MVMYLLPRNGDAELDSVSPERGLLSFRRRASDSAIAVPPATSPQHIMTARSARFGNIGVTSKRKARLADYLGIDGKSRMGILLR